MYDRQEIERKKKLCLTALISLIVLTFCILFWAISAFLPFYGYGRNIGTNLDLLGTLNGSLKRPPMYYTVHQPHLLLLDGSMELTYKESEDPTLAKKQNSTEYHLEIVPKLFGNYKMQLTLSEENILGERETTSFYIDTNGNYLPEKADDSEYQAIIEGKLAAHQEGIGRLLEEAKQQWWLSGTNDIAEGIRYYYTTQGNITSLEHQINIWSTLFFFFYHTLGILWLIWLYRVRIPYMRYTFRMQRYHGKTECNYQARLGGYTYELRTPPFLGKKNFLTVYDAKEYAGTPRLLIQPQENGTLRFFLYQNDVHAPLSKVFKTELLFEDNKIVNRAKWILENRTIVMDLLEQAKQFWNLPIPSYTFPVPEEKSQQENTDYAGWTPDYSVASQEPSSISKAEQDSIIPVDKAETEQPVPQYSMENTAVPERATDSIRFHADPSGNGFRADFIDENAEKGEEFKLQSLDSSSAEERRTQLHFAKHGIRLLYAVFLAYTLVLCLWSSFIYLPFYGYATTVAEHTEAFEHIYERHLTLSERVQQAEIDGYTFTVSKPLYLKTNANLSVQKSYPVPTKNPKKPETVHYKLLYTYRAFGKYDCMLNIQTENSDIGNFVFYTDEKGNLDPNSFLDAESTAFYEAHQTEIQALYDMAEETFGFKHSTALANGIRNYFKFEPHFIIVMLFSFIAIHIFCISLLVWLFRTAIPFHEAYTMELQKRASLKNTPSLSLRKFDEEAGTEILYFAAPPKLLRRKGYLLLYRFTGNPKELKLIIEPTKSGNLYYIANFNFQQKEKNYQKTPLEVKNGVILNHSPLIDSHREEIHFLLQKANLFWGV